MKHTSKLILNGEEYEFAAPSGGGGWQPGANTLAYYPLNSTTTVNDMKGSGTLYNLTNVGNTSFGTNAGVDCARFYGNSSTGLYNTSLSFGAYPTQTVLGWMYITGGGTSNWFQTIYRIGNASDGQMGTWYNNNESNIGGPALAISQWEYLKESMKAGGLLNNRYLLVNVTNGTSSTQYINGNVYQTYTNTLSNTQTGIYIGKDSGTANFLKGYLSEFIIENKARTAQEVSDYYNQTKDNYQSSEPQTEPCHVCGGTGEEECDMCSGTGQEMCPTCAGAGQIGDPEDPESRTACPDCDGTGFISCGNCGGTGMMTCSNCGGTGEEPGE